MWPVIYQMGRKHKECCLPSVDAETSRAGLAFQQSSPTEKRQRKFIYFIFFLLFWPDSSSARSVLQWSCKSLHLNGCALGKIQEGFHSLCFVFLPETEVQRWYFSLQQTDTWSCSLKWIEQRPWFSSLFSPLLFSAHERVLRLLKEMKQVLVTVTKNDPCLHFILLPNYPTKKHLVSVPKGEMHNIVHVWSLVYTYALTQFLMYEFKTQGWFEMIVQGPKIQNIADSKLGCRAVNMWEPF